MDANLGWRERLPVGRSAHRTAAAVPTWLRNMVDAGLMGIVFLVPFFMGGRYAIGRLIFVLLVLLTAAAWWARAWWTAEQRWVRSPADWLLPIGAALIVLQLIPLPPCVLAWLSPRLTHSLPLWSAGRGGTAHLGVWRQISLVPQATQGGLAIYLAYGTLFFVTLQRIGRVSDIERILQWIGLSAVLMAVFGVVQYLFSNGKFFWLYEHPFRTTSTYVNGSFINRNHYAHFLALGLGPVLLWVVAGTANARRRCGRHAGAHRSAGGTRTITVIPRLALGVLLFAGLMSVSRGGAIAMGVVLAVFGAIAWRASLIGWRHLLGGMVMILLVAAALSIHGYQRLARRLADIQSGTLDRIDRKRGRRDVWAANLRAIADYPLFGTGVGSHREVHPMYRHDAPDVEYTHAENGYLQVAAETGLIGLLLLLMGIGVCAGWCVRTWRRRPETRVLACLAASAAGLAASLFHSLVDFVWYIPACMALTVMLAACAARLWHLTRGDPTATPATSGLGRPGRLALAGTLVVAGIWMVADRLPPALASPAWDDYLRTSLASARRERQRVLQAREGRAGAAHGSSADPDASDQTSAMIADLERVVARYPTFGRAHLRLAGAYLETFDRSQRTAPNTMDLSQIRDAAFASRFRSRGALDRWLRRAFGPDVRLLDLALRHAHSGLRLCPLQGEGYLYLAELCFLEGMDHRAEAAYLDQAQRVRPNEPRVLFACGKAAALAGDLDQAVAYWRRCFHSGGLYQLELIRLLSAQVPATFILEKFDPRFADLQLLYHQYRLGNRTDQLGAVCRYLVRAAAGEAPDKTPPEAVRMWLSASRLCRAADQLDPALRCARAAIQIDPNNYDARYTCANLLIHVGKFTQAEPHLRWCLLRKPNNKKLRTLLEVAVKRRLARG